MPPCECKNFVACRARLVFAVHCLEPTLEVYQGGFCGHIVSWKLHGCPSHGEGDGGSSSSSCSASAESLKKDSSRDACPGFRALPEDPHALWNSKHL